MLLRLLRHEKGFWETTVRYCAAATGAKTCHRMEVRRPRLPVEPRVVC